MRNSSVFDAYEARKAAGEQLDWQKVTEDELRDMFYAHIPAEIAHLFGVTKNQVRSRLSKWGITLRGMLRDELRGKSVEEMMDILRKETGAS